MISSPGLGNINPSLYGDFAGSPTGEFHPTGFGGNNIVPCQQGTPDCPASPPFQYGYSIGLPGFPVTGLSAPGQSGSTARIINPFGGFSQTVSFTCSGLPSEATCSFANVSGGATMTITTVASSALLRGVPSDRARVAFYATMLPGILGLLCGGMRKRRTRPLRLLTVLSFCLVCASCGGANNATTSNPGTPMGKTQVTVTAATSGNSPSSHQVQVTLNV